MKHTVANAVFVDLRSGGVDLSGYYGPGEVELPAPIAELLCAQGLAEALGEEPAPVEVALVEPVPADAAPAEEPVPANAESPPDASTDVPAERKSKSGRKTTTDTPPEA